MNLFERAVRAKLRFKTVRGTVSVEELLDMPLEDLSRSNTLPFSLDQVAKDIKRELDNLADTSFVSTKANPAKAENELRMEIVKEIIAEKIEAAAKQKEAAENAGRIKAIRQALEERDRNVLSSAPRETLEAELARLEGRAPPTQAAAPVADAQPQA